jgi:SAM-dependent methyltransferase
VDITPFTAQYFAEIAELEARHAWTAAMRALTLTLIEREAQRDLAHVLDVGCGTGRFLNDWLANGKTTFGVGVDLHGDALEWARARNRGRWVRASAGRLPFKPGSFDAIHSADLLQHLSLDDSTRAFELFASLLAPGGILALRLRAPRIFRREPDVDYSHAFTRRRLRTELESRGFTLRFLSHVNTLPSIAAEVAAGFSGATADDGAVKGIRPEAAATPRSRLLAAYLAVERAWLLGSHLPLPVGHTMICIARRR